MTGKALSGAWTSLVINDISPAYPAGPLAYPQILWIFFRSEDRLSAFVPGFPYDWSGYCFILVDA
jgi:hypothetical protein